MKKIQLSFLLLVFAFIAQAQDAKPTKEQTVEYIINTLQDYKFDNEKERGGTVIHVKYSIKEITFKDDKLYVKYYHYLSMTDKDTDEYVEEDYINLKEIEKIEQMETPAGNGFLSFSSVNSKKTIKSIRNNISPTTMTDNRNVSDLSLCSPYDYKLVQAFNYLRKLCGAPEPIQF